MRNSAHFNVLHMIN